MRISDWSSDVCSSDLSALGYAGFRLYDRLNWDRDVASFLGASYFRAVGGELQYGLSARGLAIDTTRFGSEEFPMFRAFWLQQPRKDDDSVTVLALLDSASRSEENTSELQSLMRISYAVFCWTKQKQK